MRSTSDTDNHQKVKEIFSAALETSPAERTEFLKSACEGDEDLRREIESLLKAHNKAAAFLEDVSAAQVVRHSISKTDDFVGRLIGNYRMRREIGRGGMGIVFLAEREEFRQQVALKIIKRGMDSDQILERFAREREILAALNHQFVARLLDGGTTDNGAPFFVMEFVEGVPVDRFCEARSLSEKETLELFRKICEAVAFAHQKLVVHRDLKPSNILVTEDGTPKLLDFGIAKLLNSTDARDTQTNQRVLTPAYASPEHLRGERIDTTSDVYSLGKILSELLRGETSESLKISTLHKRTTETGTQKLNADLRNILAMALHEKAERRYGSIEKFSEDIRRHLVGLPISARRDTLSYRTAKFVRRNRLAVAVAVLFIFTLLGGLLATLWQAREAKREREIAERRFDNLRKVSDSFVTEIHGAIENLPGSLPARRMLMRHAVEQLDALAAESGDNPALQEELAQAYFNSAQLPDMLLAEKDLTLKKEIAIYQKLSATDPKNARYQEQMALGEIALGDITKVRGSVAGALELSESGVSILEQIVEAEPESEEHLVNLADAYQNITTIYILKGDAENARQATEKELATIEAIRKMNRARPELKELSDLAQIRIGTEQTMAGDYKSAISVLQKVLAEYEKTHVETPNDTRVSYYLWAVNRRLAEALEKDGDIKTASEHFQTALTIIESLGAESPKDFGYSRNSAITHILYGQLLVSQKQPSNALVHFRRALELSERVLEIDIDNSESKTDAARAYGNLGNALVLTGKNKEGSEYLNKAVKMLEEARRLDSENFQLKLDYAQASAWLNAA